MVLTYKTREAVRWTCTGSSRVVCATSEFLYIDSGVGTSSILRIRISI